MTFEYEYTRLYTSADGHSNFESVKIPLVNETLIGHLSATIPATNIQFRLTTESYDLDFHNAPRRQFIIMLSGSVQITTSRGEVRVFRGGSETSVLLVEDTAGKGHKSKALDGKRESLFIYL